MSKCGASVALGEFTQVGDEFWWLADGEVDAEHAQVDGEGLELVGSGVQNQVRSPTASIVPTAEGIPSASASADVCTVTRAWCRQVAVDTPRVTWSTASSGSSRGVKRGPVGVRGAIRYNTRSAYSRPGIPGVPNRPACTGACAEARCTWTHPPALLGMGRVRLLPPNASP